MIKLKELKANIGKKLFNQLTPEQRELMAKTAGTIEFKSWIAIGEVYNEAK